ncbi:MAG: BACON domain-containing protein [Bacteroidales bacterium]
MKKQSLAFCKEIRFMILCLFVSLGVVLVSCSEDDKEEVVKEPFKMELEIPAAGETKEVDVHAIADWSVATTNSSMIKILSAKVGNAGEVKIKFEVLPNNSFVSRSAELNFKDGRDNVIKIIQSGNNPDMSFNKEVSVSYDPAKKLFSDTIVVTSNLAWEIPAELPEWITEMKIIDGAPQESVTTNVALVVIADQDALKAEGNHSSVVLASKKEQEFSLDLKFAGFSPKIEFNTQTITMEKNILNAVQLNGSVVITSNVKWTLNQSNVVWLDETEISNDSKNGVETSIKVWFSMDAEKRDTEGLKGIVEILDVNSDFKNTLTIDVPPVDDAYFVVKANNVGAADDKMFDAVAGEGKYTSDFISVYGKNPNDVTPLLFMMENGRPKRINYPVIGYIEKVVPTSRAALDRVDWELVVADRAENEEYMGMNPYEERICAAVFFPNSMLDQWGDLKEEYLEDWVYLKSEYFTNEVMYRQKGLTAAAPTFVLSGIDDGGSLTLNAGGGTQFFQYEANFSVEREGVYVLPGEISWCEIFFDLDTNSIEFKPTKNTTGAARKEKIEFIHGKSDSSLFSVTLVQPAN